MYLNMEQLGRIKRFHSDELLDNSAKIARNAK